MRPIAQWQPNETHHHLGVNMTAKAEKESKPEVNEVTNQEKAVTKKQPDNEHAYVLSQAAFQL